MNKRGNHTGKHTRQLTKEEMREFGQFLYHMRTSIGLPIPVMAEKLGVFRTTLARWERGQTVPQRDVLEIEQDVRNIVKEYRG